MHSVSLSRFSILQAIERCLYQPDHYGYSAVNRYLADRQNCSLGCSLNCLLPPACPKGSALLSSSYTQTQQRLCFIFNRILWRQNTRCSCCDSRIQIMLSQHVGRMTALLPVFPLLAQTTPNISTHFLYIK